MSILLQSFAAGLAFALGTFVGIGVAGLCFRTRESERDKSDRAQFIALNKRIEERLSAQVTCLTRIADAAERSKT